MGPDLSSPQSLLWVLAPRRPLADRGRQKSEWFKNIPSTRSSGPAIWSQNSVVSRADKLLEGIMGKWIMIMVSRK